MEEIFPLPSPLFSTGQQKYEITKFDKSGPVIIDNGSFQCRAGGANHENPPVIFHNESRRSKKGEVIPHGANVGWNISEEAWRNGPRTPFDHGLLSNMDCQEDVLDFVFYSLGLSGQNRVEQPVVFSECLCSPNYCRNVVSELLFECYQTPKVGYYVDSLASFYYNAATRDNISQKDSLIISAGHSSTVVIPYLNGKSVFRAARRIDIGGDHMSQFTQTILKLKYPDHKSVVSPWVAEYIKEKHTYTAIEFSTELYSYYPGIAPEIDPRVHTIQLPVPAKSLAKPEVSTEELERRRLDRIAHGKRLKEMADKRRAEKLEEHKEQVASMQKVMNKDLPSDEFDEIVVNLGYTDARDFKNEFKRISKLIEKASNRMDTDEKEKPQKEVVYSEDELKRMNNFEEWVTENKERQEELIRDIEQREVMKTSWSNRRGVEAQQRLHLLTVAADTKTDESEFDDWDVYVTMQTDKFKEADEKDKKELQLLVEALQKYAPNEVEDIPIEEYYQMKLAVERIRIPEIVFQPCIIGEDQMGLSELIQTVLQSFTPDIQSRLADNIFVTGGASLSPHFVERLKVDLTRQRPSGSRIKINTASNAMYDTWKGAKKWSVSDTAISQFLTKEEYNENGPGYIKSHVLSNQYSPTPE